MAMTDINPPTTLFPGVSESGISGNPVTLNTTDDWFGPLFYWPGGDLQRFAFLPTAVSGSPIVTVQLFNTDASDGTTTPVNTASAIGAAVDSGTLVANQVEVVTGLGQAALAAGFYFWRIIFKSGTSCGISRNLVGASILQTGKSPFTVTVTNAGAQTRGAVTALMFAMGGSSFVRMHGFIPPLVGTLLTFDSTANPDEYGLWFTNFWPVDVRIHGVAVTIATTTSPNFRLAYYTGSLASPTQVFTQTIDGDLTANAAQGTLFVEFDSKPTLAAGATAGIGIRAETATNMALLYWDFLSGNEANMDLLWNQNATLFSRENDAGALTQVTYQTPLINVFVNGIDPGAGGSVIGTSRRRAIGGM